MCGSHGSDGADNRFEHGPIGKFRLNPGIKPRMYVMRSTMYEKAAFY